MSPPVSGKTPALEEYDGDLKDIAKYIHHTPIKSKLALDTARLVLLDTLGCGLEALRFPTCTALLGPTVPGTVVPHGATVPGTDFQLDPVNAAFNIGAIIRWLDFNDCWLAAEWGHPSDNLGAILAVADWLSRTNRAAKEGKGSPVGNGEIVTMGQVLEGMVKAHEIQGVIALLNSFNQNPGLDHVLLVKVASTAVVSKLLGLSEVQTAAAVSHAFVDGQALRTYRHAPNTMSRKSWAAGDACMRAVNVALKVMKGEGGMPSVLTQEPFGFFRVLRGGEEFKFDRGYGSYVMENVLFKVSYPAEFHSQTAIEAAQTLHNKMKSTGVSPEDIKSITCRTHSACVRIIDKQFTPLTNFADRDHCIQYMVSVMLVHGRLSTTDYSDDSEAATSSIVEGLRQKIRCVEDEQFSRDYLDPSKRTIPNALTVELKNGEVWEEVVVEAPLGHRWRRDEARPVVLDKFGRHAEGHLTADVKEKVLEATFGEELMDMPVDKYMDLFVVKNSQFL